MCFLDFINLEFNIVLIVHYALRTPSHKSTMFT